MKSISNDKKASFLNLLIFAGTILFLSMCQYFLYHCFDIYFYILNKDFFEIYSFVLGVLSLFGIYFAIIQFSLQLKGGNNTFFGIDYVSYIQKESKIYQFSTSKTFFFSLFIFTFIPILYKFGIFYIILEMIWNSIFLFLIFTFILLLYVGLSQILELTDDNFFEKRNKIFNSKITDSEEYFQLLYNDEESIKKMPEKSKINKIIFMFKLEVGAILSSKSDGTEYEKQYYLNHLIHSLQNKNKISLDYVEYFLTEYINLLKEFNIKLLIDRKKYNNFYYPLLDGFTDMHKKINYGFNSINYINVLLDYFESQEHIESPLLIKFILENYKLFSKAKPQQLEEMLGLIINLKSFQIEELEFQLFYDGSIFDSDKEKFICSIWTYLFNKYEECTFDLQLPTESKVEYIDFMGNVTEIDLSNNCYSKALETFINNNPNSNIAHDQKSCQNT